MKPIIAVDIDNVLAATAEAFADYSNHVWGTNLTARDFREDFTRMWNVSYEEALQRLNTIYASDVFSSIKPKTGARAVLERLRHSHQLVVLTSRRRSIAHQSQQWLDQHYPQCFSDVYFSGIYDGDLRDHSIVQLTKGDMLRQIGARYLVDDEVKHCLSAAECGIDSILFQPRERQHSLPTSVTVLDGWEEVGAYFHGE